MKCGKHVYGLPEKCYEVRTEDTAVDVQIHKTAKVTEIIKYIEKEMETHNVCSILDYCK